MGFIYIYKLSEWYDPICLTNNILIIMNGYGIYIYIHIYIYDSQHDFTAFGKPAGHREVAPREFDVHSRWKPAREQKRKEGEEE